MTAEPSTEDSAATLRRPVDVRIRLVDLAVMRWPVRPLVGGGSEAVPVAVPLPHLTWTRMRTTVQVPAGAGVAERIATVVRLRKLYDYVVLPVIMLLFVLAFTLCVLSWSGSVADGRAIGGVLGLMAFALVLTGYGPLVVAVVTKVPRVVGGELWLPAAHADVAREVVALNSSGLVRLREKRG
jgi:hypothetical protein